MPKQGPHRPETVSGSTFQPTLAHADAIDGSPMATLGKLPTASEPTLRLPQLSVSEHGSSAFRLGGVLGEGGMGVVRVATQAGLARDVAVKHLRDHASGTENNALLREASIMGRLEHPAIVPVYAVGLSPELGPIVVMKRVAGAPWSESLEGADPRDADEVARHVQTLIRVCEGVHFAHEKGFIHRDLKPDNVMLGDYGEVYVVDWGVAIQPSESAGDGSARQVVVGTPSYMAPEMADREMGALTRRSDVFLLGAIVHQLLYGRPPHRRDSVLSSLIAATRPIDWPQGPGLPGQLVAICQRACAYTPEDRYASVAELRDALQEFLRHQDSERMVDAGLAHLAELEARVGEAGKVDDRAERAADDVRGEFERALGLDPDGQRALDGIRRCRQISLAAALGRESLEEAQRIASELGEVATERPDLANALAELESRRASQREAERLLEDQRADQDLSVGRANRRRVVLTLLSAIALMVGLGIAWQPSAAMPKMSHSALLMSLLFPIWVGAVWRNRAVLFATLPNRIFTGGVSALLFGMFAGRWIGVAADIDPAQGAFAELLLFMVTSLHLSQIHRGFLFNLAGAVLGAIAMLLAPAQGRWIMTGVVLCQPLVAWYVWRELPGLVMSGSEPV